jgi:hypothetical protein
MIEIVAEVLSKYPDANLASEQARIQIATDILNSIGDAIVKAVGGCNCDDHHGCSCNECH